MEKGHRTANVHVVLLTAGKLKFLYGREKISPFLEKAVRLLLIFSISQYCIVRLGRNSMMAAKLDVQHVFVIWQSVLILVFMQFNGKFDQLIVFESLVWFSSGTIGFISAILDAW